MKPLELLLYITDDAKLSYVATCCVYISFKPIKLFVMRKSEHFAKYFNFKSDLIEVTEQEFYANFNKDTYSVHNMGDTCEQSYRIDGARYMLYSSIFNVGWQGDVDSDQFFCKVETYTQAEIEDLAKIFG